jgi:hypothetical protein
LTIDLVGAALASGRFNALALGSVLGGFMFVALNQVVNDFGGLLRKTSTTIYHLRRQEHQRIRRITGQIRRVGLLRNLAPRDYRALAPSVRTEHYAGGSTRRMPARPWPSFSALRWMASLSPWSSARARCKRASASR